jgi:hypothetical protein
MVQNGKQAKAGKQAKTFITDLIGLNDVSLTTPSVGDLLMFNGIKWINQAKTFISTLGGLSDVLLNSAEFC